MRALDVTTTGVANVTRFFPIATNFSHFSLKYLWWWLNLKTWGPAGAKVFSWKLSPGTTFLSGTLVIYSLEIAFQWPQKQVWASPVLICSSSWVRSVNCWALKSLVLSNNQGHRVHLLTNMHLKVWDAGGFMEGRRGGCSSEHFYFRCLRNAISHVFQDIVSYIIKTYRKALSI